MGNFTFEEMNLMCIYNTGSRTGLIDSLREMRGELSPEETELRELTDSYLFYYFFFFFFTKKGCSSFTR